MTTNSPLRETIARAIEPADWKLAEAPQYAHLLQEARDTLLRRSLEAADRVLATGAVAAADPTDEALKRFREEWHQADREGDVGNRVRRGIRAANSLHTTGSNA